jgi:hypothetical protein
MSDQEPEVHVGSPAASEHPVGVPDRQETLIQKADEDEGTVLTWEEFQELLQDPKTLYEETKEVIEKLRDLNEQNSNIREQLRESKKALRKSEAIVDKLIAQPAARAQSETPAPIENRRVGKLPDPPMFSGQPTNGMTFDNWMIQIRNKLRGNQDSYPTEELKIIYVSGRLEGNALALVSPRLNPANRHTYHTAQELYEHLEELYGDPNKERNARQGFKDLVMKRGQTFQEFYAQFLRLVADGNISSQDLKDELNDKLTWKLQEVVAMYYNNPDVTTTVFARHCTTNDQQIRARLDKRERLQKAENLKKPSYESSTKDKTSKLMSTSKTTSASTETNSETQKLGSGGRIDRSDRSDLKCYNCNKFGHISKYCPEPRTQATTLALARLSKGSDADNESENDKP